MSSSNDVVKAYHADWSKKLAEPGRVEFQKRVVDTLINLFEKIIHTPFRGRVLDLGCGDGSVVLAFNQYDGISAEGIDIDRGVNFETDRLPYADNTFDQVLMYSVVEHLMNPGNILTELKRVMKKSGHLIIITPHFCAKHRWLCDWGFYDDPTHIHPYNYVSLEHLMRAYQFKKSFIGLWTVKKPVWIWKLPTLTQFWLGALLPFRGDQKWAPSFLRGKSRTLLSVFENDK